MTCARCGSALLRVETLCDFGLLRERYVFVCGHSAYSSPRGAVRPAPLERGRGICNVCTKAFTKRTTYARKCDACLGPDTARLYAYAAERARA